MVTHYENVNKLLKDYYFNIVYIYIYITRKVYLIIILGLLTFLMLKDAGDSRRAETVQYFK